MRSDPNNNVSESNETNNACADTVAVTNVDFIATKTNSVSGSVALGNTYTWTIVVKNQGTTTGTFTAGQTILTDNLPSTGATYAVPGFRRREPAVPAQSAARST